MQRRLFIWLAAITIVLVALTVFTMSGYRAGTQVASNRVSLVPDWVGQLPQVAVIRLDSPTGEINLKLEGKQWQLVERYDYPADNRKVWEMLEQVGDVELLDAKTDNPELHQRLGLRDRSQAGAQSMQVEIGDAQGQPLVIFLIGKDREMAGQGERQYYLRRVAENQTWVAAGEFNPPRLPAAWLDRELIDIVQSRIREVTIQHPGKPIVRVSRESAAAAFELQDIPEGRSARATEVAAIAYGLQKLPLQDVNKVADAELEWDDAIEVNFYTFDGLQVTAKVQAKDLGIVARLSAVGSGDASGEAEVLNTRLSPWVFVIPNHTVSTFTRDLDGLLEPMGEKPPG
ncbi:MAG: hypothetical protein DRQ60_02525 [Gammaproteobacteria bacterium]|nr:MAG: hypothetical protein DRQ54_00825 [Gammaproteobacteria bacterium]RLA15808.1 MAG: hypothetical protein DRQ52_00970 [Gammaproteobacteria bacterium]RLA17243.1 MAG: hypothetical protein DRQ60_02525 [Gammaproteobacteria bacterium]